MISLFPANAWLTAAVLACVILGAAASAAIPTLRWGWKAWPLVLLAALVVPVGIAVILMVSLPALADLSGVAGYSVHLRPLWLVGFASALLGSGLALIRRRLRSATRPQAAG